MAQEKYPLTNVQYDIIITLANLLQGSESLERYHQDAVKAGDDETAKAFKTIRDGYDEGAKIMRDALQRVMASGTSS